MYQNPPSSSYQQASWSHVFTSYPNPAISSKLHPSVNGFFQCFSYAPKLLSTLILGEVSVQAKNLSRICKWRDRSRGNLQRNVVDDCGFTISNSQVYSQSFLSQKFIGKTSGLPKKYIQLLNTPVYFLFLGFLNATLFL